MGGGMQREIARTAVLPAPNLKKECASQAFFYVKK
jgi:hypothetical protein